MKKLYLKLKTLSVVILGIICCNLFINIAYVTTYKSSLSLDHATLTGATRYYSAGKNKFSIKPTKLTPQEAGEYVQLLVRLNEDNGILCIIIGTRYIDMYKANLGDTYTENFGYLNAGNRYYFFSTKHENRDWGYVYAPQGNVIMSS